MTNENIWVSQLHRRGEAAFDAEPEYTPDSRTGTGQASLGETVASRELRIHQLKQDQETLTQRLRSAEVERDDAGSRFGRGRPGVVFAYACAWVCRRWAQGYQRGEGQSRSL